jgi:hypothetical protein
MNQLFDECFHAFGGKSAFIATARTRIAAVPMVVNRSGRLTEGIFQGFAAG